MGTWGFLSSCDVNALETLVFSQRHQDSCLVSRDTSGFSSRIGWERGMPLNMRQNQSPFPVATGILGFLSIFKRSQSSSHFEALNSVCLSSCQRDLRPPVEMTLGTSVFSRVFRGDLVIPSSWEIQDEPAYMALQGNPALCQVRASRTPST